jgi:hypothetical protein
MNKCQRAKLWNQVPSQGTKKVFLHWEASALAWAKALCCNTFFWPHTAVQRFVHPCVCVYACVCTFVFLCVWVCVKWVCVFFMNVCGIHTSECLGLHWWSVLAKASLKFYPSDWAAPSRGLPSGYAMHSSFHCNLWAVITLFFHAHLCFNVICEQPLHLSSTHISFHCNLWAVITPFFHAHLCLTVISERSLHFFSTHIFDLL